MTTRFLLAVCHLFIFWAVAQLMDDDPCLDPGINMTNWATNNAIRPNYIPITTVVQPIVAQYIFPDNQLVHTGESFATNRNQTSVIYTQTPSKELQLSMCAVSKLGFPDDLPRSLASGYNAAILCANQAKLSLSYTTIDCHDGAINVYVLGAGTTAQLSNCRLYSTGPGAVGVVSVGGATTNINGARHCSGGFRSPTYAGSNLVSSGGTAHTLGLGSPILYVLGPMRVYNMTGTANNSPVVMMEGPQYLYLEGATLTAGGLGGLVFFDWAFTRNAGKLEANSLRLTVRNGPAIYTGSVACDMTFVDPQMSIASGVLLLADANTVSRDLESYETQRFTGNPIGSNVTLTLLKAKDITGDISTYSGSLVRLNLLVNTNWIGGTVVRVINNKGGPTIRIDETSTWTVTKDSYVRGLSISGGDVSRIVPQGHTIFYDRNAPESAWLNGKTYASPEFNGRLQPYSLED